MKQTISILKNKDGNAIVIAMMILVLLTIIGTSATRNTTVELQIVRNDIVHREHVYRAESAAMEGSQWLQNARERYRHALLLACPPHAPAGDHNN